MVFVQIPSTDNFPDDNHITVTKQTNGVIKHGTQHKEDGVKPTPVSEFMNGSVVKKENLTKESEVTPHQEEGRLEETAVAPVSESTNGLVVKKENLTKECEVTPHQEEGRLEETAVRPVEQVMEVNIIVLLFPHKLVPK